MGENSFSFDLQKSIDIVQKVIMAPAVFYREMPKSGGLVEPLIFMVVIGVVAGIVRAILGVLGIGMAGSVLLALGSIIIVPIFVAIFGFISAGILFIIWKLMGSRESYEVAFRCLAYASAISPITMVFNVIPYIGLVLGLLWITYILVNASVEVHRLELKLSWIVFGALCAVLSIASINAQITARNMARRMNTLQNRMGQIDKMNPEEAGKALGEFMKGMQKGSR